MRVSVVIPTYNRAQDLRRCLDSILVQTVLPNEVLIVDDSDRDRDEVIKSVEIVSSSFLGKNIRLKYMRNDRGKALTIAKNLGIEKSSGDIISFLDDDVILDRKYYEEILKIYEQYPHALGVEGKVIETKKRGLRYILVEILGRLFYLGYRERNKCRHLPSLGVTYLLEDEIITCEWISGASTYKKKVFNEFTYDENLLKYSWGEDQDLSYRVFKKYPSSLYVAPQAKYVHKVSPTGRIAKKEIVHMGEIYYLYLFYKIIDQSLKNKAIYLWSRVGIILVKVISLFVLRASVMEIVYLFQAFVVCIKHLKEIKNGDLAFFNDTLR
jgi:glycosyltransferase involved in cell wall biosynthesis